MFLFIFIALILLILYHLINGFVFTSLIKVVLNAEQTQYSLAHLLTYGIIITHYILLLMSVIRICIYNIVFVSAIELFVLIMIIIYKQKTKHLLGSIKIVMQLIRSINLDFNDIMYLLTYTIIIGYILQKMQWPPVGDILLLHSPLVVMQYFSHHVVFTSIYNGIPIRYPIGLHVIIANFQTIFEQLLLIPQTILIFHGFIIIVVLFTIYYIMSMYTGKHIAFILTLNLFHISTVRFRWLENWFMGQLYNGTLTWTYGIMLLVLSIFIDLYSTTKRNVVESMLYGLLLLTYPSFLFIPIIIELIKFLYKREADIRKVWIRLNNDIFYSLAIFFLPTIIYMPILLSILSYNRRAVFRHFYSIKNSLIEDNIFVIFSLIFIILIMYDIFRRRTYKIVFKHNIVAFPLFCTILIVIQYFLNTDILKILLLRRYILFVYVVMIPSITYLLSNTYVKTKIVKKIILLILLVISIINIFYGLYPQLTTDRFSKIMYDSRVYDGKIILYKYVYENVSSKDLILVDPTFSSLWLYGIKPVNLTFWLGDYFRRHYINQTEFLSLFININKSNICEYLSYLINKYNIKYVFITEDRYILVKDVNTGKLNYVMKITTFDKTLLECMGKSNITGYIIKRFGENILVKVGHINTNETYKIKNDYGDKP